MGKHNRVRHRAADEVVAFVGPVGVGKTTAVHSLSTERVTTRAVLRPGDQGQRFRVQHGEARVDQGGWTAPDGRHVGLFGTPGQVAFTDVYSPAEGGQCRLVLLVPGDHPGAVAECVEWFTYLGQPFWGAITVGVTRRLEGRGGADLSRYRAALAQFDPNVVVVDADPRERDAVMQLVQAAIGEACGGREVLDQAG